MVSETFRRGSLKSSDLNEGAGAGAAATLRAYTPFPFFLQLFSQHCLNSTLAMAGAEVHKYLLI